MATSVITVFRDDDDAFLAWLTSNPEGFFLNPVTVPPAGLMLHLTTCPHFKGNWDRVHANSSAKFCAADRKDLEQCSRDAKLCADCFQ
jgi:hypothetical protein